MTADFRVSSFENKPLVFTSLVGLALLSGILAWPFYRHGADAGPGGGQRRMPTRHDELYAVHFPQEGRGWAVGKFGTIFSTADGGETWSRQNSGTTKPLTSVSFADEHCGFIVGGAGTILTTTDAGSSWQIKDPGIKDHLLEVHALTASSAFAVGAFGSLLFSNDGGATWTKHKLGWQRLIPNVIRKIGDVEPNLNTVHFANQREGWLGGEFGLILHTADGGRTWNAQRSASTFSQISAIRFRDSFNGWAVGQKGTLLRTTDGGDTWHAISVESQQDLYGIAVLARNVVVVGAGIVLISNDDGAHWTRVDSIRSDIWFSGVAIGGARAHVVGQFGTLEAVNIN